MLCYIKQRVRNLGETQVFISVFFLMNLKNIIERCHERHEKPIRQRKTVVMPSLYNTGYPYQVTVYCAQRYPVLLADLEQANISFMPNGRGPITIAVRGVLEVNGS